MSSFFAENVLWQSFVCAIVAAFVLSLVDPYGTGRFATCIIGHAALS